MSGDDDGLGGIAKRWLRNKKTELLTTNRREREDAEANAEAEERAARDAVVGEAIMTAVPGLRRMQERQEQAEADRVRAAHDAVLARPQATVELRLRGACTADWSGPMPVTVELDAADEDDEHGLGATLRVVLETVDEQAPELAGQRWYGLSFLVPTYRGPGLYDLGALGAARAAVGWDLEGLDFELLLGSRDEGWYWTPDVGPGQVAVADDGRSLTVDLAMSGASGDLRAWAAIVLPSPVPAAPGS